MPRMPDRPNQCNSADYGPGQWGHKCKLDKHPRTVAHLCGCGWIWNDPKPEMEVV